MAAQGRAAPPAWAKPINYGIAEQLGQGHWSVNFYDQHANIYAVDGMVLAGSLVSCNS